MCLLKNCSVGVKVFMPFSLTVQLAFKALLTNKSRAFLTMLGIIIGISSVIVIISAGQGAKSLIMSELEGFGANIVSATPGKLGIPGTGGDVLKYRYYEETMRGNFFSYVDYSVPLIVATRPVSYGDTIENSNIVGTTERFYATFSLELEKGRLFSDEENKKMANVVVLGGKIATDLFGEEDPVGKKVKIDKQNWTVVGALVDKGSFTGLDSYISAPFSSVQKRLKNSDSIDEWDFVAKDQELVDEAKEEIRTYLRKRLDLKEDEEDSFRLDSSQDAIKTTASVLNYITIFLTIIAGISLLVGGIGIMNIMLVSVTERTREIGLRKAIGANYRDILKQFLVEAVILTVVGGGIGIVLGSMGAVLIAQIGGWESIVPWYAVVLSVGISAAFGIVFGYYPARKAALMDPINALRSE